VFNIHFRNLSGYNGIVALNALKIILRDPTVRIDHRRIAGVVNSRSRYSIASDSDAMNTMKGKGDESDFVFPFSLCHCLRSLLHRLHPFSRLRCRLAQAQLLNRPEDAICTCLTVDPSYSSRLQSGHSGAGKPNNAVTFPHTWEQPLNLVVASRTLPSARTLRPRSIFPLLHPL